MTVSQTRIFEIPCALARGADILPDAFTEAPTERMKTVRSFVLEQGFIRQGFKGRAGLGIFEEDGRTWAMLELEPAAPLLFAQPHKLSAKRLWPGMQEDEVPLVELTNGLGQTKTLAARLEEIFEPFPKRDYFRGGREQAERRALWRRVLTDALTSPAVKIVEELNRRHRQARLTDLNEWWCGKSPTFECRWDQTFYAPRSGARFLLEWMLQGRPHRGSSPMQTEQSAPQPQVLYVDDDIVVINKPARLSSVPGVREKVCAKTILEREFGELHVVHRLDLDTSGILAFARNKRSLEHMNKAFRSRETHKVYEARLEGIIEPQQGRIDMALALNWLDRPRQCVLLEENGGKPSVTDFTVIGTQNTVSGPKSIVRLAPVTGRTHQLRVHCAKALGCPIDGDPFYGHRGLEGETEATRLCLHAASLTFVHPSSAKEISFEAPAQFPDF